MKIIWKEWKEGIYVNNKGEIVRDFKRGNNNFNPHYIKGTNCNGYLRFTTRNNIEFFVTNEENIEPLIKELNSLGFPVGGINNTLGNIIHTQGWLHCHTSASDASGVVKAINVTQDISLLRWA